MKNFRYRMEEKIRKFLIGRNGPDLLSRDVYTAVLILLVIELFVRSGWLYYAGLIMIGYSMFRVLSRNIYRRQEENRAYRQRKEKAAGRVLLMKRQWKERHTHRYYRCPNCHNMLRVPKGKGRIDIHCPQCGTTFEKRT